MQRVIRVALVLLCVLSLGSTAWAAEVDKQTPGKKKIVFLAGGASHGFGAHDHKAGCYLLADRINKIPGFEAQVYYKDWPKDEAFAGASAVVIYCDGGEGHMAIRHIAQLDALSDKGVGIGAIHYAVEVPAGKAGNHWLKWMGGFFEINWSVNPHWTANFTQLPKHPVANGVMPFTTNDEWYYNMRFRPDMQGVTPILSAVPPDSTRSGKDDAHGGNPEVRKGIGKEQTEHVMWVAENANGSRGFGTTGGHVHWNWAQDGWRNAVLNACVWIAHGEVPTDGVKSARPSVDELLQNHDEPVPENLDKAKISKQIEDLNAHAAAPAK